MVLGFKSQLDFQFCFHVDLFLTLIAMSLRLNAVVQFIRHLASCHCRVGSTETFISVYADYQSAVAVEQTKKREIEAKKAYEKIRKDPSPKLYDKPPHLRNRN